MIIGIATFDNAQNYGAILQLYSLYRFLSARQNGDVVVIDHTNDLFNKLSRKKKLFPSILNPKKIYRLFKYNSDEKFNASFRQFSKSNFSFIQDVEINKCDVVLYGSDQVWNLFCNGGDYFYFGSSFQKRKIGVSASLGGYRYSPNELQKVSELLAKFQTVSVREKDDADYLAKILNTPIEHTVDPVFLTTKEKWREIEDGARLKLPQQYILLYGIVDDSALFEQAKYLKKKLKIPVIYIKKGYISRCGFRNVSDVSPNEFIYLFSHASHVITNSFHGICFSLIFNKQFTAVVLPKNKKANNRIINVLGTFGITQRLVGEDNRTVGEINYSFINKIIDQQRSHLDNFLTETIWK